MVKLKACLAEGIGTFTLILIGIGVIQFGTRHAAAGTATSAGADSNLVTKWSVVVPQRDDLVAIALAHGLAILVMVSATMNVSGGQLNPAVTFGVLLGGKMKFGDAVLYWISQIAGATLAALLCQYLFGWQVVHDGTPAFDAAKLPAIKAVIIEAVMTFFLIFVVYGTAVDPRAPKIGGIAIGLTVTMGILWGGPYTGAAINPARAFGPMLAQGNFGQAWVYWVGPMLGGGLAGVIYAYGLMECKKKTV